MRSIVKNASIAAQMAENQPEDPVPNDALGYSFLFIEGPEDFEYEASSLKAFDRELRQCHLRMDHFELQILPSIRHGILRRRDILQQKVDLENMSRAEKEMLFRLQQEKIDHEMAE